MSEEKGISFQEIENGIKAGLLSPAARDMNSVDVVHQYAGANALTMSEAYHELRNAKPVDGK